MTMVGADAEQLDALARRLEQGGRQLDASRALLDGAVRRARWAGADMRRFSEAWSAQHSRQLARAAEELSAAGHRLRREAQEQRAASESSGSGTGAAATGGGRSRASDWLSRLSRFNEAVQERLHFDTLTFPWKLGSVHEQAERAAVRSVSEGLEWVGDHAARAAASVGRVVNDQIGHLSSGSLEGWRRDLVHRISEVRVPESAHQVGHAFDVAGKALGVVSVGTDGLKTWESFHSGDAPLQSWLHAVDTGGDALQTSKVLYPWGFVVKEYSDVVNEWSQVDWGQPLPPMTSESLTSIYLPALGDGVKETGEMLVGNL